MAEKFAYDSVQAHLQTLEGYYESYYKAVCEMDLEIATKVAVAGSSSILGDRANKILKNWVDCCSKYKSYYEMFRGWSAKIIEVSNAYAEAENEIAGGTGTKETLDDIKRDESLKDIMSFEDARALAAITSGSVMVGGQAICENTPGSHTVDINGQTYTVTIGEDGKVTTVTNGDGTNVYTKPEGAKPDTSGTETQIISADQARSELAANENNTVGDEYAITIPEPVAGDNSQNGKDLYESSKAQEEKLSAAYDQAADDYWHYISVTQQSETYLNMTPEQQAYYDNLAESYYDSYWDAYDSVRSANAHPWYWFDGEIGDQASWVNNTDYSDAAHCAQELNGKTSNLMSPDAFYEAMAIFE